MTQSARDLLHELYVDDQDGDLEAQILRRLVEAVDTGLPPRPMESDVASRLVGLVWDRLTSTTTTTDRTDRVLEMMKDIAIAAVTRGGCGCDEDPE